MLTRCQRCKNFYTRIDLISLRRLEASVRALHTTPVILVDVVIIVITPVATPASVEMVSNFGVI